jgi:hypothetical protein
MVSMVVLQMVHSEEAAKAAEFLQDAKAYRDKNDCTTRDLACICRIFDPHCIRGAASIEKQERASQSPTWILRDLNV